MRKEIDPLINPPLCCLDNGVHLTILEEYASNPYEHLYTGFDPLEAMSHAEDAMRYLGEGSKAFIVGERVDPLPGHVWNATYERGKIWFVDGQSGQFANFEGYAQFYIVVTQLGRME